MKILLPCDITPDLKSSDFFEKLTKRKGDIFLFSGRYEILDFYPYKIARNQFLLGCPLAEEQS